MRALSNFCIHTRRKGGTFEHVSSLQQYVHAREKVGFLSRSVAGSCIKSRARFPWGRNNISITNVVHSTQAPLVSVSQRETHMFYCLCLREVASISSPRTCGTVGTRRSHCGPLLAFMTFSVFESCPVQKVPRRWRITLRRKIRFSPLCVPHGRPVAYLSRIISYTHQGRFPSSLVRTWRQAVTRRMARVSSPSLPGFSPPTSRGESSVAWRAMAIVRAGARSRIRIFPLRLTPFVAGTADFGGGRWGRGGSPRAAMATTVHRADHAPWHGESCFDVGRSPRCSGSAFSRNILW